jgi:hypothetical protein
MASAAPVLLAGLEGAIGNFGLLPKRPQVRDGSLFRWPSSHNSSLAVGLDSFDPIAVMNGGDAIGRHRRAGEPSVHSTGTPSAAAWTSTHARASSGEAQLQVAGARRDAVGTDTNAAVHSRSPFPGSIQAISLLSGMTHSPILPFCNLDVRG